MKRDEAGDGTKSGAADNHVALRPSVGQPSTEPSEQRVPRSSSSPGPTGRETVVPTSLPNLRTLTLVAAPSGSPAVDIIFVHGLGGSSHATWAKDGTPELFWPGEWLPKERGMEKARIFTFGYNADWLSTEANNQTIGNFAMDLLALMARSRNNDTGESHEIGAMPILFVAHSMGGLVVKKAYIDALNAQSNPKYLRIGSSVNAVIFLSTPHIGSDAAPLLGKLISVSVVLSDTQFRHSLERNSETLETINEGFRHHTGKLFLASFWETLETPLFAQLSHKFPGKVQVVDKGSARLMSAAYLNRNKLSISRYLHLLRNTDQDMSNLMSAEFLDLTRPRGAPNAIANTWIVSFEHIRLTDQTAADLLAFVSYIEPKAIPRSILPLVPPEEQLVRAIGTLLGYAFFTKRDYNTYDMHRLVQKATKIWLDKHPLVKEEARKEAVEHLADVFPNAEINYDNMPMCREYLPHALKIAQSAQGEDLASHYTLCKLLGHFFMWDRRLRECIYWYEQVFKWRKENSGEDDAATLDSEHYLASAYLEDGRIGEALELLKHLLKHVVAIQSQVLREDHSHRLESEHELASAYLEDGRIGEAIDLFERIVAIESRMLREDHSDRLSSQHELASAYLADGRIGEAIELFERVVAIRSKVLREDHSDRLSSQHELSRAYRADGRIGEAIELFERVVAIRSKVLREDHPDRLGSQHQLAIAYFKEGRVDEAIELMEHVVSIRRTSPRSGHHDRERSEAWLAHMRSGADITTEPPWHDEMSFSSSSLITFSPSPSPSPASPPSPPPLRLDKGTFPLSALMK
ncbi:TPR-like protein, partial [Trichodelitschia bisporula]